MHGCSGRLLSGTLSTLAENAAFGGLHVEANYDIDELNDRLVEIYRELLDGKINSNKQKAEIISG